MQAHDPVSLDMNAGARWFNLLKLSITKRYALIHVDADNASSIKTYLFCLFAYSLGYTIILHDMGQGLPRHLLRFAYAIMVMGEAGKQAYAPYFPSKRIITVAGCVQDSANLPLEPLVKRTATVEVLYFSKLSRLNGVMTALEAVRLVLPQNPALRFTFAGPMEDAAMDRQFKMFIAEHRLESYVTYVGHAQEESVRTQIYRKADIYIFPTLQENFGLSLLHAMAEKKAVIASREGAIPDMLDGGRCGLLFEKGDANALAAHILDLAADPERRRLLGQEARRKYEAAYTPETYGRAMAGAFENLSHTGKI